MKNEQILKKAIEKAVNNGWNLSKWFKDNAGKMNTPELIIFSHDFAKAFWGEKWGDGRPWQYHLQQMVLKKEPLNYLKRFL